VFFAAGHSISLDALPRGQKYNQAYFVQAIFPSFRRENKRFSRQNTAITISVQMDNSMCHNRHRVVDELCRLKILRVPHSLHSPDILPCDFWIVGDFKGKLNDRHLQGPEEILPAFQEMRHNLVFEEVQMVFESWRDWLR
jgi:hypothetical protein